MSGWFSLEAVYAKKGDALILHYGAKTRPRWVLIDGGHTGVYDQFLRPRLEQLRLAHADRLDPDGRLPLELVMVSHADADHLEGILDLTANLRDPGQHGAPVIFDALWFNGFEDLIAGQTASAASASLPGSTDILGRLANTAAAETGDLPMTRFMEDDPDLRAVVASTRQGRRLLQDASALSIRVNPEYPQGLVVQGGDVSPIHPFNPGGLSFHVLAPNQQRIDKLRKRWKKDLDKILKKEREAEQAGTFSDSSPFNLSSIMVLAKRGGRTMLLTGDGRGDDLIQALGEEGLLDQGKLHVDLFKLPHHGSDRNVKQQTFEDITARHYLVSANGEHDNPDVQCMKDLVAGRARTRGSDDPFTLHVTFPQEAFKLITEEQANQKKKVRKQKTALEAFDTWARQALRDHPNLEIAYRDRNARSLAIDLDEQVVFGSG